MVKSKTSLRFKDHHKPNTTGLTGHLKHFEYVRLPTLSEIKGDLLCFSLFSIKYNVKYNVTILDVHIECGQSLK